MWSSRLGCFMTRTVCYRTLKCIEWSVFFEELVIPWRNSPFREGTANVNCFIGTEVVFNFSTLWDMNKVWMTLAWQSRAFSFNNTWYWEYNMSQELQIFLFSFAMPYKSTRTKPDGLFPSRWTKDCVIVARRLSWKRYWAVGSRYIAGLHIH